MIFQQIKNLKFFLKLNNKQKKKDQDNLIHSNINKNSNKEIILKEKGNENKVLVSRKMKVLRRKSRKIKTSIPSSFRGNESLESKSKNNLNQKSKNEEINNKITMNDINVGKEKEIKKRRTILIDKIVISKFSIFLCLPCMRKRKNLNNYLLDEALKIIVEKLDILNIFRKLYRDEKIQEKFKVENIIDMSDECKQKINEYKCKTV